MKYLIYARREYQVAYYADVSLNITYIIKGRLSPEQPQIIRRASLYNFNKIAPPPDRIIRELWGEREKQKKKET